MDGFCREFNDELWVIQQWSTISLTKVRECPNSQINYIFGVSSKAEPYGSVLMIQGEKQKPKKLLIVSSTKKGSQLVRICWRT